MECSMSMAIEYIDNFRLNIYQNSRVDVKEFSFVISL